VTREGQIKILDFGLAKGAESSDSIRSISSSEVPTASLTMTQTGVIMGTAAYMAPEQARGEPADKRADIWAFGVILFELLAGRRPFPSGGTPTDNLAAILTRDADFAALPSDTPPGIVRLLHLCLRKDPKAPARYRRCPHPSRIARRAQATRAGARVAGLGGMRRGACLAGRGRRCLDALPRHDVESRRATVPNFASAGHRIHSRWAGLPVLESRHRGREGREALSLAASFGFRRRPFPGEYPRSPMPLLVAGQQVDRI